MENEHVYSVFGNHNGMFFFTNNTERQEDFWVFLGPLVGWGRLSLASNRLSNCAEDVFEFVEIRPITETPPSPILNIEYLFTFPSMMSMFTTLKKQKEY